MIDPCAARATDDFDSRPQNRAAATASPLLVLQHSRPEVGRRGSAQPKKTFIRRPSKPVTVKSKATRNRCLKRAQAQRQPAGEPQEHKFCNWAHNCTYLATGTPRVLFLGRRQAGKAKNVSEVAAASRAPPHFVQAGHAPTPCGTCVRAPRACAGTRLGSAAAGSL